MGQKLKTYKPPQRKGPSSIYPWDKWLDGKSIWRLYAGKDFTCTMDAFVDLIRKTAKKRNVLVSVFTEPDEGAQGAVVILPKESA